MANLDAMLERRFEPHTPEAGLGVCAVVGCSTPTAYIEIDAPHQTVCRPCAIQLSLVGNSAQNTTEQHKPGSSPKTPPKVRVADLIADTVPNGQCGCECGAELRAGRSRGFLPGHDAKLKSRLRKAGLL